MKLVHKVEMTIHGRERRDQEGTGGTCFIHIHVTGPAKTGYVGTITLQVISQFWKSIFPFCNLHHDAN